VEKKENSFESRGCTEKRRRTEGLEDQRGGLEQRGTLEDIRVEAK